MEGILHSHQYARSPLRSFGDPELEERLGHDDHSPKGSYDSVFTLVSKTLHYIQILVQILVGFTHFYTLLKY